MKCSNSSNSSKGEGNTKPPPLKKKKQVSPAKRWVFTLNNYTFNQKEIISSTIDDKCSRYIIGMETGESGTDHLQGWIEFKEKMRPMSVFPIKEIHWELQARNATVTQNINYCSKEGNIWISKGIPKPLKKLACEDNLFVWQEFIISEIGLEADDRKILWFYSHEGNVGKTTFCKYLHRKYGAICLGGKSADMKNGVIEYVKQHEHTPELVVINLPRSFNKDYLSYTGIEEVKDMFFYSGKYEGGMVDGNAPHVIVFANEKPDESKISDDRWFIRRIDPMIKFYGHE